MTRDAHLTWAKTRALEYARAGELNDAFASFLSDLGKHEELKDAQELQRTLGLQLRVAGHLSSIRQMVEWIEGFR